MKLQEIDPLELPFYKKGSLHEYDTEKKVYAKENVFTFAEVSYYASLGPNDHVFLVTARGNRYEVRYGAGAVLSMGQVDTKEKIREDALLEALVLDYVEKTDWLSSPAGGKGLNLIDGLMVRYGEPMTTYEPVYKAESRFYDIAESSVVLLDVD